MEVYLDLVVLLNFLVDFMLLMGTNRLAGYPPGWKRAMLASLLGAAYAGGCLIPGFSFLGNHFWRIVSLVLMSGIAFGWNRSALQRGAVFVLLSMALGGVATGFVQQNFGGLVVAASLVWLLCRMSFHGSVGVKEYVPVKISWQDRTMSLIALKDTGNSLKDPLTGESVLVAGSDVAEKLLGLSREQLLHPLETMGKVHGLRLVPYHAVGKPCGMMVAFRFPNTKIGNQIRNPLIAFAPEELGRGESYQMLTGGAI